MQGRKHRPATGRSSISDAADARWLQARTCKLNIYTAPVLIILKLPEHRSQNLIEFGQRAYFQIMQIMLIMSKKYFPTGFVCPESCFLVKIVRFADTNTLSILSAFLLPGNTSIYNSCLFVSIRG